MYDIGIIGDDVYVGGDFTELNDGSAACNYAAKWDGTGWSALSDGVINGVGDYGVCAFAVIGNDIYVVGYFLYLGDNSTFGNSIAVWNKSTVGWSTIGSGNNETDEEVCSITVDGNDVYVGGYFSFIGCGLITATHIAKWNNSTGWTSLPGIDENNYSFISSIAVDGENVYAGGYFTSINSSASNVGSIAKWDGSNWSALISGATNDTVGEIHCIAVKGNNVYFGGDFDNLACWNTDGDTWVDMTPSVTYSVDHISSIKINNDNIFAGCNIYDAGDNYLTSIANWNITTKEWSLLENADINGLCGDDLYVGGIFNPLNDGTSADYIAKWNNTSGWSTVSEGSSVGTNNYLNTMAISENEGKMYVGGLFSIAGENTAAFNIAKFADSENPLPVGFSSLKAENDGNSIILKWETATEINNYGFEIQRLAASF